MAIGRPAGTRARDQDRVDACAELDRALDDGQLDAEEHALRVGLATDASTLGDLHDLVDDLQGDSRLAPVVLPRALPPGTVSGRGILVVVAVAVLVVIATIAAVAAGIRAYVRSDDPTSVYGSAGYLAPQAIADVLAAIPSRTGTTTVDSVLFYPDYVIVDVQDPEAPRRSVSVTFRDGEWTDGFTGDRSSDTVAVDVTTFRADVLGGLVLGAPDSLNLDRIDSMYFSLGADDSGPRVMLHASNDDNEDGYFTAGPDGAFVYVDRFDPNE
ncbi:DUF1707 SHOCT-like domain-containing protein [Rhodococcoides corynebacterioides]|uniref:DUF1707 domain-containing protein n=1 Tax=Rhodococcoides corynebacterioides TaxID=53972 RepID=A0ABS7P7G9_9NOCA|nr:DUF1707 domain-containing protein [Rhodococcus corynebacterioides]MBY6368359.1 DUF1707 domain-containing protein [Rhodococcus corynebacterioides]MBY6407552.1 DUF1707 domain-containing protein [Rhodococcus corynebacterioides]